MSSKEMAMKRGALRALFPQCYLGRWNQPLSLFYRSHPSLWLVTKMSYPTSWPVLNEQLKFTLKASSSVCVIFIREKLDFYNLNSTACKVFSKVKF